MSALQQFEDFVERSLEGSISRLFRSPIQPVEIERRLVRVMETNQTSRDGQRIVPNRYRVQLHPDDYKVVEPKRPEWERTVADFIVGLCQERTYTLLSRPLVTITANAETPRRGIQVDASLDDPASVGSHDLEDMPLQPTAAMPVVPSPGPRRRAGASAPPPVGLQPLAGGQVGTVLRFTRPLIALGRELDNDVVIEDSRVSRHHAQILFQHDRYILRDLGSTNGTFVNGQPIETMLLAPGDRLSLGGAELAFTLL